MRNKLAGIQACNRFVLHSEEKIKMRSLKLILMVAMLSMTLLANGTAFAGRSSGGGGYKGGHSGGGGYKGGYYGGRGYYGGHYRGRGYYRGRGFYGGYYGSGLGVWFGWPGGYSPYYYPYYYPYAPYYYPYYYPPAVSVPSSPQEYIERTRRDELSTTSGVWYYCPDSKSYYPYVKECPGGWQTVPAQPPANPRK